MRKKLSAAAVVGAATVALAFVPAGASAAHCQNVEKTSPGFSYFGNDHVQETDHNGAAPGQPEGGKVHMGTPGASNCRQTTGSPSERAPGQN